MYCLIFLEGQIRWNLAAIFFFISYVSMCYLKVEHKIFHIRVKKSWTPEGVALRIIRMWCFAIEFPLPVRAGRQKKKKICQNKQSQIILILLLLFFFKCWWTRVINTGFFFDFNVVEAGEKQQHIYIQTIILLQFKLTFFSFMFWDIFRSFFPTSFFGPYKLNFGMEHHIKFISILTVRVFIWFD